MAVKEALEHVALGDPDRLAHHVSTLAEHLNDEDELVRYHLSTALVVVGCESPENIAEASDALGVRLDNESAYVQRWATERSACSRARRLIRRSRRRRRMSTLWGSRFRRTARRCVRGVVRRTDSG